MKRQAVLLIVLILTFGTVITVFAGGPIQVPFEGEDTWPVVYCGDLGVGDFWILDYEVWSGTDKLWFDENDNLTRVKWRVSGIDTLFADFDEENVVTGNYGWQGDVRIDPDTGEAISEHFAGVVWNIQLPGHGNVFHIAGSQHYEYGELVRDSGLRVEDLETLCRYFAP